MQSVKTLMSIFLRCRMGFRGWRDMRIKITEIEADARELRESNTLAQNLANLLSRCFQSNEPFDDDEESEAEEGET